MADAATYATAVNEALENDGLAPRYTQRDIRSMVRGERTDVLPNVDWRKAVLRNAGFNHDLNLSFDGSGGSMRYFVPVSYTHLIRSSMSIRQLRSTAYPYAVRQHPKPHGAGIPVPVTWTFTLPLSATGPQTARPKRSRESNSPSPRSTLTCLLYTSSWHR